ncbi:CYTH and CHAD domain-containing protein [Denitromonas ohlonensis]|uniref:CHAD domain-containing protein n=2 Tax=Denitromonas TaxID=139331 RepID=A0A557RNV5_9RHOO|nr:CYTH and CHAD domain-containing protein [Denitromonas ohlonensis]TVO66849.1 CHAD domain-containing protein [Denitromonas ohlonensis]TVO79719.1 CHAD domain-containing protein [Denitromonas ohlonensis]
MSTETELKLALAPDAIRALRRHPLVTGAEKLGNAQTLINTYFDTAELTLHKARIAVRTRKQGNTWLQTIKCAANSAGGLSSRPEWEQPYSAEFDFSQIDAPPVRKRLEALAGEIQPVFTTTFKRETRRLTPSPEVEVLMMIDQGQIDAGERKAPISEVELELVRGNAQDLFAIAGTLAERVALMPTDRSKAERGYRLFLDTPDAPRQAAKSAIHAKQSPLDAFRTLAFDGLQQWQENTLGALVHDDPEYVHQLRVALRRLRSLIRLFGPVLPDAFAERWTEVLRDTAADLGDTRNIDVLLSDILDPAEPEPLMGATLTDPLRAHALALRDAARADAQTRLTHADHGQRILGFAADIHQLNGDALNAAADLTAFARLQLATLRKRARKRFTTADILDPDQLHDLRVSLKQLRYGIEFFRPLFGGKDVKQYLAGVRQAQADLGYLNDAAIARSLMLDWADREPALIGPAHFTIGWHAPLYARTRRRVLLEIEALLTGKTPWRASR